MGVEDLHRIKRTLEQKNYHSILSFSFENYHFDFRHCILSDKRLIGRGFIMKRDNNSKHTFKLCSNYLQHKEKSGKLKIMVWPPQSLNLNPIELLWNEIDRRVRKICLTLRSIFERFSRKHGVKYQILF